MANKKRKKSKKRDVSKDLEVVLLIVASIVLGLFVYVKSGTMGKTLSPILGGLIGWIKYLLPVGMFTVAISIACDEDKNTITVKLAQYVIFLICISTIITVFTGKLDVNKTIQDSAKDAYTLGTNNIGGGALGTIVAMALTKLVGKIGTVIIAFGVAVITAIFVYGIKPAEILKNIIEERRSHKQEREPLITKIRKIREEAAYEEDEIEEPKIMIKEKKDKKRKVDNFEDDENEQINIQLPSEGGLFKKQEEEKKDTSKEVLTLEHTLTIEDEDYEFPPIDFLNESKSSVKSSKKALTDTATKLQRTLHSFGVSAKVENVSVGPTITRYELKPSEGVRVSKIANLADDIALNLAAETIRIEAPIPGKQAVGIEIPNKEKEMVVLRDIIDSDEFRSAKSKLSFAVGKDAAGDVIVSDIAKMPHVLIAGSTGSGKSVCINTLIASIIYKSKPSEVKLLMVDPKVVELSVYNGIPHLLIPVVTDPKKAAGALAWAVQEMVNRYHLFAEKNVRDIQGYNEVLEKEGIEEKLPQIVIIIDELADLMMVAAKDVEDAICRLAQMARAAGMHLVIATQRPSVDVITGIIKANIASRIAFAVTSQVDSRTILDAAGAEKLLGKGDMLFYPSGVLKPQRIQGAFISDTEVEKIVTFLKENGGAKYSEDIIEKIEKANSTDKEIDEEDDEIDPFLIEAIDAAVDLGQASASFIQRRFKVGYARAGRIIDQMEARGIISGYEGSKPRQVLISKERWEELKMSNVPAEAQDTAEG